MSKDNTIKINEKIENDLIKIVGSDKKVIQELSLKEAIALAKEQGFDLIEIAVTSHEDKQYSVCVLQHVDKFLYQQEKSFKKAVKKSVKEIKISTRIEPNDLARKLEMAYTLVGCNTSFMITIRRSRKAELENMAQFVKHFFGNKSNVSISIVQATERSVKLSLVYKK